MAMKNPDNPGEPAQDPRHLLAAEANVVKFEGCAVCSLEQIPQTH